MTESLTPLLETNDIVLKKTILSIREHYDLEDKNGNILGEAEGNLFQFPAMFIVKDLNGLELMHIEGKIFSLRKQFSFHDSKALLKLIGEEYWIEKDGVESCGFMEILQFTITKW